jgi:hypothetical protein
MRFLEQDDPVGIGASLIVVDPPDVGGLGKSLLVDQYPTATKSGLKTYWNNNFVKPQVSFADLTNLKRQNAF